MKGYFEGYEDGISDTKRNLIDIIDKYGLYNPLATIKAIEMFVKS